MEEETSKKDYSVDFDILVTINDALEIILNNFVVTKPFFVWETTRTKISHTFCYKILFIIHLTWRRYFERDLQNCNPQLAFS